MALSKTTMATFRYNELLAAYPDMASIDATLKAAIMKYYEADSSGIIQEFVTNAVVPSGIVLSVDPVTHQGSTTGPGKVT